jgi:signal transduction histidine kinase
MMRAMQTIAAVTQGDPRKSGRFALVLSLAGLTVFAAVVALVAILLRERLRTQIVARDAAVLSSVTALEMDRARALNTNYALYLGGTGEDALLSALLNVSRLDGVVALRVFDGEGHFVDAAPTNFVVGGLSTEDLSTLRILKPVSHYREAANLSDFIYENHASAIPSNPVPILEVLVPIYERNGTDLKGVAQFLLDGRATALAYRELDRNLILQTTLALFAAFVVGGGLVSWSFFKLHRSNLLLSARTRELARANRELALRSRISAIGSVTAHLLHGLKNPLAALSMYVEERRKNAGGEEGLEDAGEAIRRMGGMIEESVSILGQDAGDERFDYALSEIGEVILSRSGKPAAERGVHLESSPAPEANVDNRRGNLLALAAENLLRNAIEATPEGKTVRLDWITSPGGCVKLTITDSGPGLPQAIAADPFKPVRSGKRSGSGVGMAIAAQLVSQMGGTIALETSGPCGTVFTITFVPGGTEGGIVSE